MTKNELLVLGPWNVCSYRTNIT